MSTVISIDAMGGDRAPEEIVKGAAFAAAEMPDVELQLVGIPSRVSEALRSLSDEDRRGWGGDNLRVVPAERVIGMGESPVEALRKKRGSSIEVGVRSVRDGSAQAFVSAGNTGACVAASQLFLRLLEGVQRAGILVAMRIGELPVSLIDVGANVAAKAEHLIQYAIMASLYSEEILQVENPRVGLLNIGEEDEKGTELVKKTRALFETADVNFIGYVEGDDFYRDTCDVVVCDGFTGNVVLKVSEGVAEQLVALFKRVLAEAEREMSSEAELSGKVHEIVVRSLGGLKHRLDYSEYGGAPLLGVDGTVVIAHGRSDANAILNAIRVARKMVEVNINGRISEKLKG